jgi:translation initiation factor 4G
MATTMIRSDDEQQELIKSLSFSSSEDGDGRTITTELLKQLQEEVTATRTSSTNLPLHELFRGASYMSASENTAVASNVRRASFRERALQSPPLLIDEDVHEHRAQESKRSIFGRKERKKYNVRKQEVRNDSNTQQQNYELVSPLSTLEMEANIPTPSTWVMESNNIAAPSPIIPLSASSGITTPPRSSMPPIGTVGYQRRLSPIAISPITPSATPARIPDQNNFIPSHKLRGNGQHHSVRLLPNIKNYTTDVEATKAKLSSSTSGECHYHSQAFLLSLAFFFIWTPQNLLAPNLTQAAFDFGYEDKNARDLYFGSYPALASSVLSLPVSAGIGIASDVVSSRRILISVTTLVGGLAAIWTSIARTYPELVLSRFIGGSAMSGSVPVVFSLLSDWFDDEERNAASSGFTAMMGAGIILGQVFAGWTGPTVGWRYSFLASGTITILLAIVTMMCLREPIRGGKEKVLQKMIASGTRYDKKLTWSQFVMSMSRNSSNSLLIIQGFFSNVPWGVMFVFLNDFLSQEKGLTVSDATFVVAVFGFGAAAGGIFGGYLGGLANQANRSYLPLFMALTTYLGILPFLALLNDPTYTQANWKPCLYAFAGGCLASMPSVNVRPCIINCNPPEIRGAALTAANLVINSARGTGVSSFCSVSIMRRSFGKRCSPVLSPYTLTSQAFFLTSMMRMWGVDRQSGFNVLIIIFWSLTAIQLAVLAKTLPADEEQMLTDLLTYADSKIALANGYGSVSLDEDNHSELESQYCDNTIDDDRTIYSIETLSTSFDAVAARSTLKFIGSSLTETGSLIYSPCGRKCRPKKKPALYSLSE